MGIVAWGAAILMVLALANWAIRAAIRFTGHHFATVAYPLRVPIYSILVLAVMAKLIDWRKKD